MEIQVGNGGMDPSTSPYMISNKDVTNSFRCLSRSFMQVEALNWKEGRHVGLGLEGKG